MASTQINPRYDEPETPWWKKFLSVLGGVAGVVGGGVGLAGLAGSAAAAGAAGAEAAGAATAAGSAAGGTAGAAGGLSGAAGAAGAAKGIGLAGIAKAAPKVIGGVAKLASMASGGGTYKGEGHVIPNRPGITGPSKIAGIVPPAPAAHGQTGWESASSGLQAMAGIMGSLGDVKELVSKVDQNPEVAKSYVSEAQAALGDPSAVEALGGRENANLVSRMLDDSIEHYDTLLSGKPSRVFERWRLR